MSDIQGIKSISYLVKCAINLSLIYTIVAGHQTINTIT